MLMFSEARGMKWSDHLFLSGGGGGGGGGGWGGRWDKIDSTC